MLPCWGTRGDWPTIAPKNTGQRQKQRLQKNKRVNIRISGKDLELLQERALIEGIPYQTLMSRILHKYVYGNLVDKVHSK